MSGAGDNILVSWAADLDGLEGQIEALQDAKRDLYATVREEHGKATAAALKKAVKIARMDSEKRDDAEEIDAEAERILALIESRAPRATRAREIIEQFPSTEPPSPLEEVPVVAPDDAAPSLSGAPDSADEAAQTVEAHEPDSTSPAESEAVAISAPIPGKKPMRPHCLRPQMCAGQGRQHCYECTKAHADAEGFAA